MVHPGKPTTDGQPFGVKPDAKISITGDFDVLNRPALRVSVGCHVEGAKLPQPCPQHLPTTIAGTAKRTSCPLKPRKNKTMRRFRRYVDRYIRKHFVQLDPTTDVSFESWIETRPYPEHRKQELREIYNRHKDDPYNKVHELVKAFVKDESYPEFKHSRGIYSTSDMFKCLCGPWFSAIEAVVFKNEQFIKKVPVRDRPRKILELFREGCCVGGTDYRSFESKFDQDLFRSCEFKLYLYMTELIPGRAIFLHCLEVIAGPRMIRFRYFVMTIWATRLSGEMCTSLGNGFTNMVVFSFTCTESGVEISRKGYFEGDDGINTWFGKLKEEIFSELGFDIKIEYFDRISEASFCGLIFDEVDLNNVTNPIEAMIEFAWMSRRYVSASPKRLLELLRCKSLSMFHQYPGCPILSALAQYGLRMTKHITIRPEKIYMDQWNREQLLEAIEFAEEHGLEPTPVGSRTRQLVERKFKVRVEDQERIERYLDSKKDLLPISIPVLEEYVVAQFPAARTYYDNYTCYTDVRSRNRDYPILPNDWKQCRSAVAYCNREPGTRGYAKVRPIKVVGC